MKIISPRNPYVSIPYNILRVESTDISMRMWIRIYINLFVDIRGWYA